MNWVSSRMEKERPPGAAPAAPAPGAGASAAAAAAGLMNWVSAANRMAAQRSLTQQAKCARSIAALALKQLHRTGAFCVPWNTQHAPQWENMTEIYLLGWRRRARHQQPLVPQAPPQA